MDSFFSLLFNLLVTPPGNYLYYLILAVIIGAALQNIHLSRQGESPDEGRSRAMLGLILLLLVQLVALSSSLLGWMGLADPRLFLPPIDRAAMLATVGILFWLWAFPERSRPADSIFLTAGAVALFFLLGNLFNQSSLPPEIPYNASLWDWVWQILTMIAALIAVMTLANRKPDGWQIGAASFVIVLAGCVINLAFLTNEGSYSGIPRLVLLVAFLILPAISQRFRPTPPRAVLSPVETPVVQPNDRHDFEEIEAWLELNGQPNLETFFPALTRLVCQTLRADRCFIVVPSESRGQISLQAGYNNETGESFPLSSASDALLPAITRAAFFSRSQIFGQMENREELNHLAVTAQIPGIGSAMFEPFSPQQKKWGGVLAIKSSTRKALGSDDQEKLKTLSRSASQVLGKIVELNLHAHSLKNLAQELEETRRENLALKDDLKRINEQSGYERAEPELNALLAVQQESQDLIASLQRDNRQLQKELEEIKNGGADPNPARLEASKVHAVEALLEELRQPVAALEEWISSLLAGPVSAGEVSTEQILKALHASLENLGSRLGDLKETEMLVKGLAGLEAQSTDVNQVIDQALASTRAQLSHKALNLRIDIPDSLPILQSYPGSLKLSLVRAIENAITASPIGADIELKVRSMEGKEGGEEGLLFQVFDHGGQSAALDDLLRAGDAPDPDNGSVAARKGGLFLARRLAEAQGGRLWIENGGGDSSILNILMPLRPLLEPHPEVDS